MITTARHITTDILAREDTFRNDFGLLDGALAAVRVKAISGSTNGRIAMMPLEFLSASEVATWHVCKGQRRSDDEISHVRNTSANLRANTPTAGAYRAYGKVDVPTDYLSRRAWAKGFV